MTNIDRHGNAPIGGDQDARGGAGSPVPLRPADASGAAGVAAALAAFAATPPFYNGDVAVAGWDENDKAGRTVRFVLLNQAHDSAHPFKGMRWGREHGQRLHLAVKPPRQPAAESVYDGGSMLLWWDDNPRTGMTVKLAVEDGPDTPQAHPFKGHDGETLTLVAWAVDDDETPARPDEAVRRRPPFIELPPLRQATILCAVMGFRRWLAANVVSYVPHPMDLEGLPASGGADPSSEWASAAVRLCCGVRSRKELGQNSPAGEAARECWRRIYADYAADANRRRR